jgi:hypothetical protein
MRGRVRKQDGALYLSGLRGWQTSGVKDGCFQRVRPAGGRLGVPTGLQVKKTGIRLEFAEPLADSAGQPDPWTASRWNYRWTSGYGSPHFKVSDPSKQGEDALEVKSAKLSPDRRSVFLEIGDLKPVMQMKIGYRVEAAAGGELKGAVYHTVHALGD